MKTSRRPQTKGMGGGIGKTLGRPSTTMSKAKPRSPSDATISPSVTRSPLALAAISFKISDVWRAAVTRNEDSMAGVRRCHMGAAPF